MDTQFNAGRDVLVWCMQLLIGFQFRFRFMLCHCEEELHYWFVEVIVCVMHADKSKQLRNALDLVRYSE